jgi:hypothetical protein
MRPDWGREQRKLRKSSPIHAVAIGDAHSSYNRAGCSKDGMYLLEIQGNVFSNSNSASTDLPCSIAQYNAMQYIPANFSQSTKHSSGYS